MLFFHLQNALNVSLRDEQLQNIPFIVNHIIRIHARLVLIKQDLASGDMFASNLTVIHIFAYIILKLKTTIHIPLMALHAATVNRFL